MQHCQPAHMHKGTRVMIKLLRLTERFYYIIIMYVHICICRFLVNCLCAYVKSVLFLVVCVYSKMSVACVCVLTLKLKPALAKLLL